MYTTVTVESQNLGHLFNELDEQYGEQRWFVFHTAQSDNGWLTFVTYYVHGEDTAPEDE